MDDATMRGLVAEARVGRLATVTPDGRPHVVPCCFALVGDVIYSAVDGKPKSTLALQRLANVAANPAASLLVDHYDDDWSTLWWVRVDGPARVVDGPAERTLALHHLTARYPQYGDVPPPGDVLAIDATRWRSWP